VDYGTNLGTCVVESVDQGLYMMPHQEKETKLRGNKKLSEVFCYCGHLRVFHKWANGICLKKGCDCKTYRERPI